MIILPNLLTGIELLNAIEIRLKKSQDHSEITSGVIGLNDFIDQAYGAGLIRLTSDEREIVDYQKKHVIYKEDQRPRFLYYIVRGKIKVYKRSSDGKELITNILKEGEFWGYLSILENTHYRDNAEVLEDASLMQIPASDFLELVTDDPKIAQQFIRLISCNALEKEEDLLQHGL